MMSHTQQDIYATNLKASLTRGFFLSLALQHFPIPYLVLKLNSNYVCAGPKMISIMIKKQLMRDEGDVPYAYQDSLGYWTIGVGFLIDKRKGGRLPDAVRDFWLDYEISKTTADLEKRLPFFSRLSQARKDTLVNMAFNLGVNGLLNFKKTIDLMAGGKHTEASREMLDSRWARQVGQRANRLSQQWREDRYV